MKKGAWGVLLGVQFLEVRTAPYEIFHHLLASSTDDHHILAPPEGCH